nr:MAG TPA: hypothetical protein [Caudoviricetes sp.]
MPYNKSPAIVIIPAAGIGTRARRINRKSSPPSREI